MDVFANDADENAKLSGASVVSDTVAELLPLTSVHFGVSDALADGKIIWMAMASGEAAALFKAAVQKQRA